MITGGTGSFGNAVLNRFLQTDIGEIRVFSRDGTYKVSGTSEYFVKWRNILKNRGLKVNYD